MSTDNPDISMLKRDRPTSPIRCESCNGPINPLTAECRCSD